MRKITILEVLDPIKNEFIPIRQAINQGLFNTKTYLFFDPMENKHYSITEASKRGMFKSAIDLRPEALIVERIKVAQTVSLISARDPHNPERLIPIQKAIELGIVDTSLRIYRDTVTNKVIEFGDAIDSDLIQAEIVREVTEKVTETLTEQKNPDNPENLGILKKIETHTFGSPVEDEPLELTKINGVYVFDRTKSLSINKMLKKYDDDIAAGFITDSNSSKILKSDSKSMSPLIDFNEAVAKNLVILPDSLCLTQNVLYVLDLNTGNKFDFEAACEIGLIDVKSKTFYDTRTNQSISLFEALEKNFIVMKNELYNNYGQDEFEESNEMSQIRYLDLKSMFDPSTGMQISVKKAIEMGILSKDKRFYVDLYSGKRMTLNDAVEKGLAVLKPEKIQHKINEGYQFLHISGVHDPVTNKDMTLAEAINAGFLDYSECEFHDPTSGKTLTLLDAYDKGYLITRTSSVDESDSESVKTEPIVEPKVVLRPSRRTPDYQVIDPIVEPVVIEKRNSPPKIPKSQSMSPKRVQQKSNIRSASSFDIKSLDKLSSTSRKSVITRLKEKMLGKKSKYNRFDELLIQESMKIQDSKTKIFHKLKDAIDRNLLKPDDLVIDTLTGQEFPMIDAIKNGLIKFFHPLNNFEFKYDQSCSIFNNEYLLLVNYVIDPETRKKIGLKSAFANGVIDKENCVYFKRKPISLLAAIEKGYLSCEIVDLSLMNNIITSNVFKLYRPEERVPVPVHTPTPPPIVPRNVPLEDVIDHDEDNEVFKPGDDLAENKTIIPKDILEQSGIIYNPDKVYSISEIFDADQDRFVSLKKALFLQIFDLDTKEYVDSKTGTSISLLTALKKRKIRIKESNQVPKTRLLSTPTDYDEIEDEAKQPFTSTLKSSPAYESLDEEPIHIPRLPLNETISYDSISNSMSSRPKTEVDFDILKCLLYKKATNGKYIRFERVVKNKFFDSKTGKVKDLKNDEFYDFYEALRRGLYRINDSNVIFDESRVYVVDSVLWNSRKITLPEALEKKVIDKSKYTCKFLNHNYTFNEALKQGFIEAKVVTYNEIKWALEDYAKRLEERYNQREMKKRESAIYTPVPSTSKTVQEFFIFDGPSDSYISINDAFYNGILLNDPIRIKDPATNNYILLKDAIIKGLVSCEAKHGVKNKSSFLTHNRKSYIIDGIYEPRKKTKYSLQDAIKTGVFNNGVYKNFIDGKSLQIDEALQKGYVLGRLIDFDVIEFSFTSSLSDRYRISSSTPPVKPSRGVFVDSEEEPKKERPKAKSFITDKRKKSSSQEIIKSKIEPFSGRIVSIQDVVSGKYLKVDDAEKFGLINFRDGTFKNSLTNESLKINDAMERGFILVESNLRKLESRKRTMSIRSGRTLNSTRESLDFLDTSKVEIGQQFDIISVLDPIKRKHLSLDESIQNGIFDVNSTMYIDPRTQKKSTLVDAIDLGLIKIADQNFRPSYKLVIEENDKNFVKNIKTLSIRYVVDSFSQQILPLNIAVGKKLVNLDNGTYIGYEKILSLKEAYDKCLVLTCDDLDRLDPKRSKTRVVCVRKSTTGKNMSLKSALAKNWINLNKRVYIDKQTNNEVAFSQAVDMDLIIMKSSVEEDVSSVHTSVFNRSKSKDGFLN